MPLQRKAEEETFLFMSLPKSGMASETWGSVSATKLRNTVNESKMVTPEEKKREKEREKQEI